MMNKLATILLFLLLILPASGQKVYEDIYKAMSRYPHRLAGSKNSNNCLQEMEAILVKNGLKVNRQTFESLVPKTNSITFKCNGLEVKPVYALAPNNIALNSTSGQTLKGPVVYAGKGSSQETNGLKLFGSIVLLDLGSPNMSTMFTEGALAVIFVGKNNTNQWQVSKHFSSIPFTLPRFYIDRQTALKLGVREKPVKLGQGEVSLSSKWADKEAVNLSLLHLNSFLYHFESCHERRRNWFSKWSR